MARRPPMLYPFHGIVYFLSTPSLWPRVLIPFLVLVAISIALFVLAFMYLFPTQIDFLSRHSWPHWLAYIAAMVFTLVEAALGSLVAYLALMPIWEDSLFDAVLRSRKLGYVLDAAHMDYRTCFNGLLAGIYIIAFQSIVLLFFQLVTLIVLLPLHAIPVIGTIVYCYLNGWVMAFSKRIHYDVELRKMSVSQSRKYAWKHRSDFCEYGAVAVFLEMVPFLNLIFFWTNVVGAALWVADEIEEARRQDQIANRTGGHQEQGGSQYVTFRPYDSHLPSAPLLGGHQYDNYGQHHQQQAYHAAHHAPPAYHQQAQEQYQ